MNEDDTRVGESTGDGDELPPSNFTSFIFSMSTTALMDLGDLANPETNTPLQRLDMAKHTIDLIAMLKDKTRGNLTEEESGIVENILTDLRLRYCKYVK